MIEAKDCAGCCHDEIDGPVCSSLTRSGVLRGECNQTPEDIHKEQTILALSATGDSLVSLEQMGSE